MRRLHRLSITGIYARIGLGLRLSRAWTNKSDWLIRGRGIPGMQLNERPNPLRFAERLSPSKKLASTKCSKVRILSLITKNCLSWISGKRGNTIYINSWLMRRKLHVKPVCGRAGALTSDPWLCSQSAREHGLQKCGLFLKPLVKIRMHFLNVSHLMSKPTKWPLCTSKTQMGIRPVWSESSQCAQCVAEYPMFLHAHIEYSDQTGRMHRLICVFARRNGHFVGFVMRRFMYTLQLSP